jgi:iron(III) transport system substrate-binding protein
MITISRNRLHHRITIWTAAVAVALVVAGCGSPDEPPAPPASTQPSTGSTAPEVDADGVPAELVAAAKQEGEVVLFASLPENTFQELQRGFMEKYGINLVFQRLNAAPMQEKVGQEISAGKLLTDVVALTNDPAWFAEVDSHLAVLDPAELPELTALPADSRGDKWAHGYQMYLGWAYNTDLISDEDLPADIADWVDMPELVGQVGTPHPVVGSSYRAWHIIQYDKMGQEGYEAFLRGYIQGLEAEVGDTIAPMVNEIAAGELMLAGPTHWAHARPLADAGAPIDYLYRSPVMSMGQAFLSFADGPHPNAGKLFINWLLSQEGQNILCGDGSCASHLDVAGEVAEPQGVEIIPADWDRAVSDFATGYIVDFFSSLVAEGTTN